MPYVIEYLDQTNGYWETLPRLYPTKQAASQATDGFGRRITERYDDTRITLAQTSRLR